MGKCLGVRKLMVRRLGGRARGREKGKSQVNSWGRVECPSCILKHNNKNKWNAESNPFGRSSPISTGMSISLSQEGTLLTFYLSQTREWSLPLPFLECLLLRARHYSEIISCSSHNPEKQVLPICFSILQIKKSKLRDTWLSGFELRFEFQFWIYFQHIIFPLQFPTFRNVLNFCVSPFTYFHSRWMGIWTVIHVLTHSGLVRKFQV